MPKPKKETQKEAGTSFIEAIRKLKKKVRKELDKNKKSTVKSKPKSEPKKKKVFHTKSTKSIKEQLKQSGIEFKSDAEKAEKKKKKRRGK